jgi:hypothetical protein
MKLTKPSRNVFYISVVIAILALLENSGGLNIGISSWGLLAVAYIVLLLGVLLQGL